MFAQRFVDNQPQTMVPQMGLQFAPSSKVAIPQKSLAIDGSENAELKHVAQPLLNFKDYSWSASGSVWSTVVASGSLSHAVLVDVMTKDRPPILWHSTNRNTGGAVDNGVLYPRPPVLNASETSSGDDFSGAMYLLNLGFGIQIFLRTDSVAAGDPGYYSHQYYIYWDDDVAYKSSPTGGTPPRNLKQDRYIYHPTLGGFSYPSPPTRTFNYYRNPLRGKDVASVKTLRGSMTVVDPNEFDDIVISEVWEGNRSRTLSMTSEFLNALMLISNTPVPLGRSVGWSPFDLSYARHEIIPISLTVGAQEFDVREWREELNTSLDAYLDQTVVFSFRLRRPAHYFDTLIVTEGY